MNFAFDVNETARALRRAFELRAAEHGVTRARWRVLARLNRKDGLRQVELADFLEVEPITLSRIVDGLEESGLVERRRDEADRRAWRIHLTDKARPVVAELRRIAEQFNADALAGISDSDRERVLDVLERVRANVAPRAAATGRTS